MRDVRGAHVACRPPVAASSASRYRGVVPTRASIFLRMGLLSLLLGCRSRDRRGDYHEQNGVWYYRTSPIADADGPTFEPLSDHYAKDRHRVYWADTYRDGQEYFLVKRDRVTVVAHADPATFRSIDRDYARDAARVYFEGVAFPVRDVDSFALLDYGWAHDRVAGYFHQVAVPESDGATFAMLDSHYARDAAHVFYAAIEPGTNGSPPVRRIVRVAGADVATFAVLDTPTDSVDARDRSAAYHEGVRVPKR